MKYILWRMVMVSHTFHISHDYSDDTTYEIYSIINSLMEEFIVLGDMITHDSCSSLHLQ